VQGDQVRLFEDELAAFAGVASAVAVSSGTAALHLALLALDVGEGDEVILPSYVCTALLHAVRYVRAIPVLADIDDRHFNIAAADVKKHMTTRTKAIIIPHLFGQAADLKELLDLGVPVIEDCAQSLGSRYHGKMTGGFGVMSIFSFYATKLIATGEGGMVVSNNPYLVDRMRDLRDYDEKDDNKLRYNYKMTDLQAALGRSQLQALPGFLERRVAIAGQFDRLLQNTGIDRPWTATDRDHIYFRYVIRHVRAESLIHCMNDLGIACRRPVYKPLHHYLGQSGYSATERAWREALSLPIYPSLAEAEMARIASSLKTCLKKGV